MILDEDKNTPPLTPVAYAPKTIRIHQLGSVTLQSLDQVTSMSADEIEKVAERVLDGAQETADALREVARRVRESGVRANERLANFVKVANTCADAARILQRSVEHRDDPVPPRQQTNVASADLDALATQISDIANGGNGKAR